MFTVIWKGLRAHRVRLLLTGLSVLLGVSFLAGTFAFTDSVRLSFARVFDSTAVDVDLVVRAASIGGNQQQRERIPDFVVDEVRSVGGVAAAEGVVQGIAKIVGPDGATIQQGLAPTIGMSWPSEEGIGPARLVDDGVSRPPQGEGEVVVDVATATEHGFDVGDVIGIQVGSRAVESYTLVGVFEFGGISDLAGTTFAAFALPVAQAGFDAPGQVDFVNVRLDPDADAVATASSIAGSLIPGIEVVDAGSAARDLAEPLEGGLDLVERVLLAFAGIGVLVAGFIILNTFSVLVAQRVREIGLLRSLGAGRRQILLGIVTEAVVVGVLASVIGVVVGIVVVDLLLRVFPDLGLQVPDGPTVVRARTVVVALTVGIAMTVISSLIPAWRAARVPPVVAHGWTPTRDSATSLVRRSVAGAVVLVAGALLATGGVQRRFGTLELQIGGVALGCFLLFVGLVALAPVIARVVVPWFATSLWALVVAAGGATVGLVALVVSSRRALDGNIGGAVMPALVACAGVMLISVVVTMRGVLTSLTRGNAMRNPRRTTATASALVLGLAVVLLVTILVSSVRTSLHEGLETGIDADIVLSGPNFLPISREAVTEVATVDGVAETASVAFGYGTVDGYTELVAGVAPSAFEQVIRPELTSGAATGLEDGILVSAAAANRLGVSTGDTVGVAFSQFGGVLLPVVGVYENRTFTGSVIVDFIVSDSTFEASFGVDAPPTLAFVAADDGLGDSVRDAVESSLASRYPDIRVQSVAEFRAEQDRAIDMIVNILLALLAFSMLIAVLGIVNTLLLSVYERTRELGLLRTVGMSARQLRRMVRGEAMVVVTLGCLLGLALGLLWGAVFATALEPEGVNRVSVQWWSVISIIVVSAAAGMLASSIPAWRAARLDVLEAVAQE